MLDALIDTSDSPAIPLTAITETGLESWLADQSDSRRQWVGNAGFNAAPGSTCLLPGPNGQLEGVLVGVSEPLDLWACAALPTGLPAGGYAFDDSWPEQALESLSLGWALGSYGFDRYKAADKAPARLLLDPRCEADHIRRIVRGVGRTRDLINTPAQDMMPQHLAAAVQSLAEEHGGEYQAIVGDELLAQNYPIIHAVGRASVHAPRLLDLRWGDAEAPKLTLVGKGVCFDSGGLDLKPANAMRWMKKDMGGAAHVIGLADMIMAAKLPVRLRVLVPAVENAVSGNAFRPGDVLTGRSGKTVEIDNTDAEGRLVLCDALTEAVSEDPDLLIDMATLTGAARVAMGPDVPALFSNRAATASTLQQLSEDVSDLVWPMPLYAPYKRWLKSDIADLVNSSTSPLGGAITAALFLQDFVGDERDWLHMDVMAFNNESLPGRPRGGEAMGLRGFFAYLNQRYGR